MAIVSKFSKKKRFFDIRPIYFDNTGRFSGDVMAVNEWGHVRHLKLSSLAGTTIEDRAFLDSLGNEMQKRG